MRMERSFLLPRTIAASQKVALGGYWNPMARTGRSFATRSFPRVISRWRRIHAAGVGHSHGAFVGGSPQEQARLPKSSPKRVAQSSGPLYADVVSGKAPGRTRRDQITQYRPVGNWGLQFSSVGALVYRRAQEQGLGRTLPTEWFLQDIKN